MNSSLPKISVIIPIYNAEKYLTQCLDSVQAQSLQELEIICVDDGSLDDTCAIVSEYIKHDNRISLYKQNHGGAARARNLALTKIKGEYVAFLDGDDFYFDNSALKFMYDEAKNNNADICASYRKNLYGYVITNDDFLLNFDCQGKSSRWIDFKDHQNDWHFHSFIFKHDFLKQNNIYFPDYLRYEDPVFLLKSLILAQRFLLAPVFLYCYRLGYKNLHLNELQVYHNLLGIYDNLLLAQKYHYNTLFELLLIRIDTIYYNDIASNLSSRIFEKLENINRISKEILPSIPPLKLFNNLTAAMQNMKYEEYLFPFKFIGTNKRILLYGAGIIGQALYYQFKTYGNGNSQIIGVIDRDREAFINQNLPIFDVNQVSQLDFDYIILATEFHHVAQDMKNKLCQQGVSDNKIFWDCNGYNKRLIYANI